MINPSFKQLEEVNKSRYDIAMMTARRAKELIDGEKPIVKSRAKKPVTIALSEIMSIQDESEE